MEVGTLSAKELKSSLSKKSPMPRKSLKRALQSPYESVRPICTNAAEIEEIMRRLLAPLKKNNTRVPWSEFRKLTKEERQAKKEQTLKDDMKKGLRSQIVFGMNELLSGLQKHSLSSAVMCEDIVPVFMMNFIVEQATVHRVPIIILPQLRKLTLEILGFSCSCLGVKKIVVQNESSHFSPLNKTIVKIAKGYELPGNVTLCQCPKNEPLELSEHFNSSEAQTLLWLVTKGLDYSTVMEANSAGLRPHSIGGHWEIEDEKLMQGKNLLQAKKIGDELEGKNSSASNEMLQSYENEESSEIFPDAASKSTVSKGHPCKKNPEAHPYLRTFLKKYSKTVKKQKQTHTTAESLDDGKAVGVGGSDAESTALEISSDFKYIKRAGKNEKKSTLNCYKPLKVTDG